MSEKELALELMKAFLTSVKPESNINGGPKAIKDKADQVIETYCYFYEKIKSLK